ncbi:hypothetical protein D3C99_02850 [Vibrio cholerae]|nr:hypothetical protein [Vibrio cholerae]
MSGYVDRATAEDVAAVVVSEFWQIIYGNLSHLTPEQKALIYQHAKKAAVTEAKRCFTRETKN